MRGRRGEVARRGVIAADKWAATRAQERVPARGSAPAVAPAVSAWKKQRGPSLRRALARGGTCHNMCRPAKQLVPCVGSLKLTLPRSRAKAHVVSQPLGVVIPPGVSQSETKSVSQAHCTNATSNSRFWHKSHDGPRVCQWPYAYRPR
jgi:hypothetical protein